MFQYQQTLQGQPLTAPASAGGTDIVRLVMRLWAARRWGLAGAGAFALAALMVSLAWPQTFRATAQLYIDPQNLQLMERTLTPAVPSTDAGVVVIESQARILQSTSVLERVAERLDLAGDPEFGGGGNPLRSFLDPLLGAAQGTPGQRVLTSLARAVYAVRLDRTYIVEVHAKAGDAGKAAEIANGVVSAYLELREEQRGEQASLASSGLESRLQQLLAKLQADENAVQAFKLAHGIVASNGALLIETQLAQANQSLAAAGEALQLAEARLGQLQALAQTPALLALLPEAAASADLQRLRAEADAAQRRAQTLTATLGPRHPDLATAEAEADAAARALAAALSRLVANAGLAWDRAAEVHANAQAELDRLVGSVQAADASQIRLRQLTREAEASRAVYEEALLRARETHEQAQLSTVNAYVVSKAAPPAYRSFPPRLAILLPLAALAGLAAGLGLALMADRLARFGRGGNDAR